MAKLTEIFEILPLTERTLLKRIEKNAYDFALHNDTPHPCLYRVEVDGQEIGAIQYYNGRKLCCRVAA